MTDSYLRFYFRFIYVNQSLVELGQYDLLKSVILRDENEIDVIAVNDFEKTCEVYEVKRQASRINFSKLDMKVNNFKSNVKSEIAGYSIQTLGLSMEDM